MNTLLLLALLSADHAYVVRQGPYAIAVPSACATKLANAITDDPGAFPGVPLSAITDYGCGRKYSSGTPTSTHCAYNATLKGTLAEMITKAKSLKLHPNIGTDGGDRTLSHKKDRQIAGTALEKHKTFVEDCLSVADVDVLITFKCKRSGSNLSCIAAPLKAGSDSDVASDGELDSNGKPTSATPFVRWATAEESP